MTKKPAAKTKKAVKPAAKATETTSSKPKVESAPKTPESKPVETKPVETKNPPPSPPRSPPASGGGSSALFGAIVTIVILGVVGAGAWVSRDHWWTYVTPLLPSGENDQMMARVTAIENRIAAEQGYGDESDAFAQLQQERDQLTAELSAVMARLKTMEESLASVERMANAVTVGGSPAVTQDSIRELTDRLTTLEVGGMNADTSDQLGDVLERLRSVEDQAEAMETAAAQGTAALASVQSKIEAIEARPVGADSGSTAAALVLGVGQLRDAVRLGASYERTLEALSSTLALSGGGVGVAGADAHLQVLSDYAASGVPTLLQLQQSYDDVADAAFDASAPSGEDGLLSQTLHQLKSIVRIRDTDASAKPGSVESNIARAEDNLTVGDLVGTVQVLSGLEGPAATAVAEWLASAKARLAVDDALAHLHNLAINHMMAGSATPEQE
jgi:hypothetical protein